MLVNEHDDDDGEGVDPFSDESDFDEDDFTEAQSHPLVEVRQEVVRQEEINIDLSGSNQDSVSKPKSITVSESLLSLNIMVDDIRTDRTGQFVYLLGANTPIYKYDMKTGNLVKETEMPIHSMGASIDINDNLWVHNLNNHKLMKFNKDLGLEQSWEGQDEVNIGSKNTLSYDQDLGLLAWYKGSAEVRILEVDSGKEIEEVSHIAKEVSNLYQLAIWNDRSRLISLTLDRGKTVCYLNDYDINKEKVVLTKEYSSLFGKFRGNFAR